jgi:hypothetical protein
MLLTSYGSRKKETRYICLSEAKVSHPQRMWAKISSLTPHFLHSGLSSSPNKWRCLLRVLCPVRRPVTTLDWVLLEDKSLILVPGQGPEINSWACLRVFPRSHQLAQCWLISQRLSLFLIAHLETPKASSVPRNLRAEPPFANPYINQLLLVMQIHWIMSGRNLIFNPLNTELNPICHLLSLLGGTTIVVVSRLRVKPYLDELQASEAIWWLRQPVINPCGTCSGQSGTETGFSPSTTVVPVTNIPSIFQTDLYLQNSS